MARSGTLTYMFLIWNLFLAGVPAFAAAMFDFAHARRRATAVQGLWLLVWFVFLPNAPYIVIRWHIFEQSQ